MKISKTIVTVGLGLLLAAPMSASAASYTLTSFTDLGVGEAISVNNSGVVAGYDTAFAYTWKNKTFNNFGRTFTESSKAIAINNNGTVLGKDTGSGKNFTYNPTTGITFSNVNIRAQGINNSDTYVGYRRVNGVRETVTIDSNGTETVLKGIDRGYGINDSNQVAGFNFHGPNTGDKQRAVLYDNGTITHLGTLGGFGTRDMSFCDGLNNNGDMFGNSWHANGTLTAYFWENGTNPHDLQKVPTVADEAGQLGQTYMYGINDLGWLVGKSWNKDDDNKEWEGVLYDGEDLIKLNDLLGPGFIVGGDKWINDVKGVSDTGWIVGTFEENGTEHAFAMQVKAVPVPGTVLLLATGLMGLIGIRRKRN